MKLKSNIMIACTRIFSQREESLLKKRENRTHMETYASMISMSWKTKVVVSVASMRVGVLTAFAAQIAKKDLVLDIGDSGEPTILVLDEAKEVAANDVVAHLKVHSTLASTLREPKVLKHFLLEAPLKSPMEHFLLEVPLKSPTNYSLVGREEGYSGSLASEPILNCLGAEVW
jgi:hypothetical protein